MTETPRYLSNSELSDWRRCPRMWYLKHVMKLAKPTQDYGVAHVGTLAHEILEAHYLGGDPAEILERYSTADLPEGKLRDAHEMALSVAEGYIDWLAEEGADQAYEVAGVEREFTRPITGRPGWYSIGKLDLLLRHRETGEILPSDHKSTAQGIEVFLRDIKRKSQFPHYAHLLQGVFQEWPNIRRFMVTVLRQSKRTARATGPFYERTTIPLNDAEIAAYDRHLTKWSLEIEKAEQAEIPPPDNGPDCSWRCPFYRLCPRVDDGSDWQGMAEAEFVVHDPLARYTETPH